MKKKIVLVGLLVSFSTGPIGLYGTCDQACLNSIKVSLGIIEAVVGGIGFVFSAIGICVITRECIKNGDCDGCIKIPREIARALCEQSCEKKENRA